ncbi:MAG: ATP-binding protein [Verrucomicrobiota bacterium]|jgi:signal transduction histidine kinase
MKQMGGSFQAIGALPRAKSSRPAVKLRLAGLVLTALLGSILVVWVSRTTWERVGRLQHEFAGLNPDSFYLGVRMKGNIQRLNDTLLRYRLRGESADYDLFLGNVRELTQWFEANRTNAITPLERQFFEQMGGAYYDYLNVSTNLLVASNSRLQTKVGAFPTSYEKVQQQSQHLLDLCDAFIYGQRLAFNDFLEESNNTLTTFQRLLKLSVALLLALIAALAMLVYRGMIAPLRYQLTESQAIITRQEKLASLGVLAAGVAHEIRNPLTAINFRLYSLRKSLPGAGVDNEDIFVIASEISRLERIVKDFLQFARPSEPELVAVPPQRILQEVHSLLKPQLEKAAIELKLEPSETAWVRADTHQIKEALINLVQNSADSIGRNGTITLRVRDEAGSAVLEVVDTGKGIPAEVQKRLFDPFFTTKEGGTGLGLPIAARIVEKHGGELRYQTQPNRGTIFAIVLPHANEYEPKNSGD